MVRRIKPYIVSESMYTPDGASIKQNTVSFYIALYEMEPRVPSQIVIIFEISFLNYITFFVESKLL